MALIYALRRKKENIRSISASRDSRTLSPRKKVTILAAVPQLVVHVFVVKICSEQIYGVFLCFVVTGTAKS
jgi:hypothetical protein